MADKTFLVVDDEEVVRKVLERYFRKKGVQVVCCKNGPEALEQVKLARASLMLLDISMPGMDGLEVLRRTRELAPNLPVIMVTAAADLDTARRAMELGARDFIKKPIDLEYLDTSSFWLSWLNDPR